MKIEDLEIYNLSMNFSDKVWNMVCQWEYFAKDTVGKQWVRAADSVDATSVKDLEDIHLKIPKIFISLHAVPCRKARRGL